jgi:hypothetical protein
MQESFVDRVFSFIWFVVTSAFWEFFNFVGSLEQNFGLQTGGFILVMIAIGVWLTFAFLSFHNLGAGRSSSFAAMILIKTTEGVCNLFGIGCLLAGLVLLGRYYW